MYMCVCERTNKGHRERERERESKIASRFNAYDIYREVLYTNNWCYYGADALRCTSAGNINLKAIYVTSHY